MDEIQPFLPGRHIEWSAERIERLFIGKIQQSISRYFSFEDTIRGNKFLFDKDNYMLVVAIIDWYDVPDLIGKNEQESRVSCLHYR